MTNNVDSYPTQLTKINTGIFCPSRGGEKNDIIHSVNLAPGTNTQRAEGKHHKKRVTANREKKEWEL